MNPSIEDLVYQLDYNVLGTLGYEQSSDTLSLSRLDYST